ncbi:hypothetical protein [Corynebacterium rhinophilum]|uniref:hypothetical protein n=1 Tax=Corynebacterium rhinophilum TaxID=3050197 RepID=UPI00254EBF5D|nr:MULTISPECIES: hypothetical protein [unclassified Corynebacterium]MDK8466946.1 hypothetical protein [Corynebacterium sp. MSK130]MDK8687566.1 hypothetical protein [Corynebacterium sp. MSK122]
MTPMTPEEAERWLEEYRYAGYVSQLPARRALQTIAEMEVDEIVPEPHPRGSWNGDSRSPEYFDTPPGVPIFRYVTEWQES